MKKVLSDTKLKQELAILANKLNSKCEELGGGITFICVLNGGFMFFSDLVKLIKYPIKIDFIQCKSYNSSHLLFSLFVNIVNSCFNFVSLNNFFIFSIFNPVYIIFI